MKSPVQRATVDLSAYPDMVVIYLGMRVNALRGLLTVAGLGPKIMAAGQARPPGLLHAETNIVYSMFPFQIGMRWYWQDFESMEAWTRSPPHREWWQTFLRNPGGTGFWHETYCMSGGIEAVYDDLEHANVGLSAFAPRVPARARRFNARERLKRDGVAPATPEGMSEAELDGKDG
ncbi:MAG: DUF4188 domain-containing protein [Proteobacteria bacterium]|nr:DUF4188 domain-containing protein [Pseudomonadota bacterium]